MIKDIWFNLPVNDVKKSKEFFSQLGFSFNEQFADGISSACLLAGEKNVVVMFFDQNIFRSFTQNEVIMDPKRSELLVSLSASSKEEVDDMAQKVKTAGGNVYAQPGWNQGWMYGFGFSDPDGHKWNMLFMDLSRMPK